MINTPVAVPLIKTKLYRPRLPKELILRPQLVTQLSQYQERPFLFVSAPAGYGKTTLVNTWLESCGCPSAWLSLDEGDDDLAIFLEYLVAAVQEIFPEFGGDIQHVLHAENLAPSSVLAGMLLNALDVLPHDFVLVLDDYHFIRTQAIHDLLTQLLRYPPRPFHLVMITRRDPPLPLPTLRARQQMAEIRIPDLRFSLDETAVLFQETLQTGLNREEITILHEKTEGWITGLHLAAISLRQTADVGRLLTTLSANNQFVTEYLLGEVLAHVSAEYRERVLQTAVLDRFCASLCQALWSPTDRMPEEVTAETQDLMAWLAKSPFVISLDPANQWHRHHRLIQEILLNQLHTTFDARAITSLHSRASQWFAAHGYVSDAIRHALVAEDTAFIIQIIRQHRYEAINQEEWPRLERWLRLLPEAMVESSAELLLLRVWILQNRWRVSELPPVLDRVAALLQTAPDEHLQGELSLLRCPDFFWGADGSQLVTLAQQALAQLPLQAVYARDIAWLFFAVGLQMTGDLPGALVAAQTGLQEIAAFTNQTSALRLSVFCYLHWTAADLPALQQSAADLLRRSSAYNRPFSTAVGHYFSGCVCYEQDNLLVAESHFVQVLERRYQSNAQIVIHSVLGLASIYLTRGLFDKAQEMLEVAEAYLFEMQNATQQPLVQAYRAHLALGQSQTITAAQWMASGSVDGLFQVMVYLYSPAITYGRLLLAQKQWAQAAEFLRRLQQFLESIHNIRFLIETLVLQSLLCQAQGKPRAAQEHLERALTLAAPSRFIRLFASYGRDLAPLLAGLAQQGIAPDFIAQIQAAITKPDLTAEAPPEPQQLKPHVAAPKPPIGDLLTNREIDVLLLLEKRLTNKEIAVALGVSVETVKGHTVRLFQKLDSHNRRHVVRRAYELGILPLV